MTDTEDARWQRVAERLNFPDETLPSGADRAIADIAGSVRRLSQRAGGSPAAGTGGLQARLEAVRNEILGTRGSSSHAQVRRALAALAPPGGGERSAVDSGGWSPAPSSDGRILSAAHRVLIARVAQAVASMGRVLSALQPVGTLSPPDPEAVEATRVLAGSALRALVAESRRPEPRFTVVEALQEDLRTHLDRFDEQMRPDGEFESDADRRQNAELGLLVADREALGTAWDRFREADRFEPVERVRRQMPVVHATHGRLRDALREAGISDEEADAPEAQLDRLELTPEPARGSLPPITLAGWLDTVVEATGGDAQARLTQGGSFALLDVANTALRITNEAGRLLDIVHGTAVDPAILTALREPLVEEELRNLAQQMNTLAIEASPSALRRVRAQV
jgi:hypothetical protein